MRFTVRAPATTANLGPGFDCLGLALDMWNEVEVTTTGRGLQINLEGEGADLLPRDETNAVYRAMSGYAMRHKKTLPDGLILRCVNRIPLGAGLGSSAAAAAAGILCAEALLGLPRSVQDELEFATQLEGHPDNATPCLMGGLTASAVDRETVIARSLPIRAMPVLVVTPDFALPTHQARAALPQKVSHKDAVFNLGRTALVIEALRSGDLALLGKAIQDRLHQPYRIPLIPGAAEAMAAGVDAGAAAVAISGAGPSLLAVLKSAADGKSVAAAMMGAFKRAGLTARVFTPAVSFAGAEILPL